MFDKAKIKRYILGVVLYLLVITQYSFILAFSNMPANQSSAESRKITSSIEKFASMTVYSSQKKVPVSVKRKIHYFIRKGAHLFNFFILGFLICMLLYTVYRASGFNLIVLTVVNSGVCAAFDEFVQFFVEGRGAKITDIIWDLSGVLLGCCFFALLIMLCFCKTKENLEETV